MARHEPVSMLMSLPLEVRHSIFEYLSARKNAPKNLLRHWFEKEEAKGLIAQHKAGDPSGPEPIAIYNNYYDSESESESDTAEENDTDAEDAEEEEQDNEDEDGEYEEDSDGEGDGEDEDDDEDEEGEDEIRIETAETEGDADTSISRPVVRPHTKWRHIPNFMHLTHCPPPVELLLTSRQLNDEASNWYYDAAILHINATGGFAHTSFFEVALGQIADAAFSPMQNIRKAKVTFVWDSVWIRTDTAGFVEAVFPALLRQRASLVYKLLLKAPDLREVVIHWHDSIKDDESMNLMMDALEPFYTLLATVKVEDHYIAANIKPSKRSIAGKRRLEFENILQTNLDIAFF